MFVSSGGTDERCKPANMKKSQFAGTLPGAHLSDVI